MSDNERDKLLNFFNENRVELHGFLLKRLRNLEDTEDLLQELFIRAEKYNGDLEIIKVNSFVYRMANNLAIDKLRQKKRMMKYHSESDINHENFPSHHPSADQLIYDRSRLTFLQEALNMLSEKQKKCFILSRCDNLTYKEIGLKVGLSESMVKKHVAKALAHCRKYLRNKE